MIRQGRFFHAPGQPVYATERPFSEFEARQGGVVDLRWLQLLVLALGVLAAACATPAEPRRVLGHAYPW